MSSKGGGKVPQRHRLDYGGQPFGGRKIVGEVRRLRERLADFPNIGDRGEIHGTRRMVLNPFGDV